MLWNFRLILSRLAVARCAFSRKGEVAASIHGLDNRARAWNHCGRLTVPAKAPAGDVLAGTVLSGRCRAIGLTPPRTSPPEHTAPPTRSSCRQAPPPAPATRFHRRNPILRARRTSCAPACRRLSTERDCGNTTPTAGLTVRRPAVIPLRVRPPRPPARGRTSVGNAVDRVLADLTANPPPRKSTERIRRTGIPRIFMRGIPVRSAWRRTPASMPKNATFTSQAGHAPRRGRPFLTSLGISTDEGKHHEIRKRRHRVGEKPSRLARL